MSHNADCDGNHSHNLLTPEAERRLGNNACIVAALGLTQQPVKYPGVF